MRCYHFCNMYLVDVHAGIQSAHTQHELAIKYLASTPYRNMVADESLVEYGARLDIHTDAKAEYIDWANNHKTLILLNGGMMSHLLSLETFLNENNHSYAWAAFREDEDALNGALTNIGLVLPEHMYRWSHQVLQFVALEDRRGFTNLAEHCTDNIVCIERAGVGSKEHVELTVNDTVAGGFNIVYTYTPFDIELLRKRAAMRLM